MITYFAVMGVCAFLASDLSKRTGAYSSVLEGTKRAIFAKIEYVLLLILLIWFSGLRTGFNDTGTYTQNFQVFVTAGSFDWENFSILNYGGFELFQYLLKTYVSKNAQILVFTCSVITNCMYMHYIIKHSKHTLGSFILFVIGLFAFSMGGMKQAIAIAFGLYAVDGYNEKKYLKALLMFVVGFSFHPYVICILAAVLLNDRVWSGKTMAIVCACVAVMANLQSIMGIISDIGKDYTSSELTSGTINPLRIVVESVPVVISFLYRHKINETEDKMLIIGTNMNIIGFAFLTLGFFFNPVYMGRIAIYFTAFAMISVPKMLEVAFGKNNRVMIVGYYCMMVVYYILDLTKLGTYSLFQDQFYRISIGQFFQNIMS